VRQHDIYLVRHGATEWSESGRHTGRTNIPLTDAGRDQARSVATLLSGRTFASVLVSPMHRAVDTCTIAGFGEHAIRDPDLCEWDYGDYEGLTTAQIRDTKPGWTVWTGDVPNGETIEQVAARADRVIARALATDGDVALFAHGHILRVLTARWCELAPPEGRRFVLDTGTLNVLGWERECHGVLLWNAR
jgi:broad specificity phosphatase PhoE